MIKRDNVSGEKAKNSTKLFFSGVFILTLSNVIVKVIGLMFRIPMHGLIGDEGMGYYNSAYQIYSFLYMLSTAGLPVAVSIMISESRAAAKIKQVHRVFKVTLFLFLGVGLVGMSIMLFGANALSKYILQAEPSFWCIIAIAPTLFFVCVSSALRGYFHGYQQMIPTAVSELLETLCKLVVGIVMALYAIKQGYPIYVVAAYAVTGLTIGTLLGMVFLIFAKLLFKEKAYNMEFLSNGENTELQSRGKILKRLVIIALPITISSSVMSLTNMIDAGLVQGLLQKYQGMAQEVATAVYGNYTTLAVPMFNLPPVLVYPIAVSIIPLISTARVAGDTKRTKLIMESSLRVAALIGIPCGLGMAALSEPILDLFYDAESAVMAGPLLTLLAPSTFFVCLLSITNAILQAAGRERKTLISMVAGATVKVLTNVILIRFIGMRGTPISTFLCYLTITSLNFFFIIKYVKMKLSFVRIFAAPLGAGVGCAAAAALSYLGFERLLPKSVATLAAIMVAGIVYTVLIFVLRAITPDDVKLLPKGEKIYGAMKKLKIMK